MSMNEEDLINARKYVGTYKINLGAPLEEKSLLKETYLPVEFIHWIGMGGKFAYVVEDILQKHEEYGDFLTALGENGAFIAVANDNVEALEVINKYVPHSLNYKNQKDTLLKIALEERSEKCLNFLLTIDTINWDIVAKNGQSVAHMCCRNGNSNLLEALDEKIKIDWSKKDFVYNRTPLYFVIEDYLAHKNYWLFEMVLEKYTRKQLLEKDGDGLNVLEFLLLKMKNQPKFVSDVYEPLVFSLKSAMGISEDNQ